MEQPQPIEADNPITNECQVTSATFRRVLVRGKRNTICASRHLSEIGETSKRVGRIALTTAGHA